MREILRDAGLNTERQKTGRLFNPAQQKVAILWIILNYGLT